VQNDFKGKVIFVTSAIPSSYANTVAPYAPLGRQPVGQESPELKASSFKALEQSADSARSENRRSPDDRPNEQGEQQRVSAEQSRSSSGQATQSEKSAGEKARLEKEQKQINELVAIDREVHAHEQAHAAVGGEYAGTPTYKFVKGPDGISYAVGGEVSVDTGPIPNDPEATIRKAQQIRQAANAPADPSPQDRRIAAEATRLESEARAQLQEQGAIKVQEQERLVAEKNEAQKSETEQRVAEDDEARQTAAREQLRADEQAERSRSDRSDILLKVSKKNINLNRHLVEIGAVKGLSTVGSFLNRRV